MDLNTASREELIEQIKDLRRQVDDRNNWLHAKNLELDALHYVWCDGSCPGGIHRYSDDFFPEDLVLRAEYQAKRLRTKYNAMLWIATNYPSMFSESEWHIQHAERIRRKLGL